GARRLARGGATRHVTRGRPEAGPRATCIREIREIRGQDQAGSAGGQNTMAINLIERPGLVFESTRHHRLSTVASAALHAAVALTMIAVLRTSPVQQAATSASALIPDVLIWIPHTTP